MSCVMCGGSGCEDAPGKAKRTRPWFGIKAHTALGCVQTARDDNKKRTLQHTYDISPQRTMRLVVQLRETLEIIFLDTENIESREHRHRSCMIPGTRYQTSRSIVVYAIWRRAERATALYAQLPKRENSRGRSASRQASKNCWVRRESLTWPQALRPCILYFVFVALLSIFEYFCLRRSCSIYPHYSSAVHATSVGCCNV